MTGDRVKVLAIMGAGRSGSTLLDTLLGSIQGFFSTGELRYLWTRGLVEKRLCGCGIPLAGCPVWSQVLSLDDDGTGPLGELSPALVHRWQERLARTRHTVRLLHVDRATTDDSTAHFLATMDRLYRRIQVVTGARVIVDSSKRPSDAALLRLLPGVDPFVIHLVRDPRAVAHSWSRRKIEPDSGGIDSLMPQRSMLVSTRVWVELNAFGHVVRQNYGTGRSLLVRYEDLVRDPARTVASIVRLVGEEGEPPIDDRGEATVAPNHTVGGNPARFSTGRIRIRPDDEWRLAASPVGRPLTNILAAPLNLAYGYPLWPTPGRARPVRLRGSAR